MKSFIITWKANGNAQPFSTLITGESWSQAVENTFHKKCVNSILTYEEVSPYFLMLDHPGYPHPIPVTLYYTQHGTGKVFIKKVVSPLPTLDIKKASGMLREYSYPTISQVAKEFVKLVNQGIQ